MEVAKSVAPAAPAGEVKEEEPKDPATFRERWAMKMPSCWLASMLVHLSILLILAAIPLVNEITRPLVINFNSAGDDLDQGMELGLGQDAMVSNLEVDLSSGLGATQATMEVTQLDSGPNAVDR